MIDTMMNLRSLVAQPSDTDILWKIISFAAGRLMKHDCFPI